MLPMKLIKQNCKSFALPIPTEISFISFVVFPLSCLFPFFIIFYVLPLYLPPFLLRSFLLCLIFIFPSLCLSVVFAYSSFLFATRTVLSSLLSLLYPFLFLFPSVYHLPCTLLPLSSYFPFVF